MTILVKGESYCRAGHGDPEQTGKVIIPGKLCGADIVTALLQWGMQVTANLLE